jgi:hypothetical protein
MIFYLDILMDAMAQAPNVSHRVHVAYRITNEKVRHWPKL